MPIYDDTSNTSAAADAAAGPPDADNNTSAAAVAAPPNADNNAALGSPGDETLLYKDGEAAKAILAAGRYRSSMSTTALLSQLEAGMSEPKALAFHKCLRPLLAAHDKRRTDLIEEIPLELYFPVVLCTDAIYRRIESSMLPEVFIYHALRGGLKEDTLELVKGEAFAGAQELVDSIFPGWKS